ncbi:MAG TPA: hypothetical protein VNV65_10875 [Candidatus Solibacter sp.]|jgi:hypothetical protein|nr:hypothetical protein [Candidatus Solibacter sp.]
MARRQTLAFAVALAVAAVFLALVFRASNDAAIYNRYIQRFATSLTLPPDYPPATVGLFALGYLPPLPDFALVFAVWMLVVATAGRALLDRFVSSQAARTYSLLLVLGCAATVLSRFDIVPAVLTLVALLAMERRRWTVAVLVLAVATDLKLYPGVLLPVVLAVRAVDTAGAPHEAAQKRRDIAWMLTAFLSVVALGLVVPTAIGSLTGHSQPFLSAAEGRPIEIESVPGSLLWLAHFLGAPAAVVESYGSRNFTGVLETPLRVVAGVATAVGLLFVYWATWRRRLTGRQAFLLTIGVLLLTNKVFSPQYLIWLIPFVAIAAEASLDWLLVAALTVLEYPVLFSVANLDLQVGSGPFTALAVVIGLRNLALAFAIGRMTMSNMRATRVP